MVKDTSGIQNFIALFLLFFSLSSFASSHLVHQRKHGTRGAVQTFQPQFAVSSNRLVAFDYENQKKILETKLYKNIIPKTPHLHGGTPGAPPWTKWPVPRCKILGKCDSSRPKGFAREFLDAHNQFRASLGLAPLAWDRNLTRQAREHSTARAADCTIEHTNGPYGENMFWGASTGWTPFYVVLSWIGEGKNYDPKTFRCLPNKKCGHFTQLVWKSTKRVGCWMADCANGGVIVTCNYDPPGNYVGENPFTAV